MAVLLLLANAQRDLERRLAPADTTAPETIPAPTLAQNSSQVVQNLTTPISPPRLEDNVAVAVIADGRIVSQAQIISLATAQPPATIVPLPGAINGIPLETFIQLSEPVTANVRTIYLRGQERGRNPRAFSKIGDSSIADGYFLSRFDGGSYQLGPYAFLQNMLDHFAGSFARDSVTVRQGMHSWSVLDPFWADRARCEPEENPLACEDRLHNPSFAIIRLGTNDFYANNYFAENMREIIETLLELDIVPILGTKADRTDGANSPNNGTLRALAAEYQIPLWDFDAVAATLPGQGLAPDGVHLTTYYSHDYEQAAAFERGHAMQNLTALLLLEQMHRLVSDLDSTVSMAVED